MKANGWREATLGELCDQVGGVIQTGPFGSQLHESDYSTDGIPVVMPKDINEGRIATASIARVSPEHVERLSRHKLEAGDIVYGRRGDIGRQALVREAQRGWLCGTGCLRLSLGDSILDPGYLHYYLRQDSVIAEIAGQAVGATLPNLNTGILRSVRVRYPALPVQRKIARTLNAYDELIENNQRRIQILDEMARGLYREWFVEFRFPGRARQTRAGSRLDADPDCWATIDLSKVCVEGNGIQTGPFGSQLHQADYSDDGVPVVMPKGLIGFRIQSAEVARIPESLAEKLTRHRMQPGDIVYGRRGDIGRRAFVMPHQAGWFCGTGCLRIRPNSAVVNGWYLFNYLGREDVVSLIAGRAQGVTMPNLNSTVMSSVSVQLPPRKLQEEFARVTYPMAEARECLIAQSENLRATRDLLLPRLVSGTHVISTPRLAAAPA